jgi:hypothetical protein
MHTIQITSAQGRLVRLLMGAALCLFFLPLVNGQSNEKGDLDAYKWRVTGLWWYSHPSGSIRGSSDEVAFDLEKDFRFGSYSTFSGNLDWHFKRKHHFTFNASPVYSSASNTLSRDITFQGVTYHLGATVSSDLNSLAFAPGYQWDFIRRRQGYLAFVTAINLLDTSASVTGTGTVNNVSSTRTASASVFAPLPVLGGKGRWYPVHNSPRFSVDGGLQGMYFFGYGNFMYGQASAQVALHHNLNLKAGYQMGTRLSVQGTHDHIGLRLTQKGAIVGLEGSW